MKHSILIFIAVVALAAASSCYSQATQEWVQTYNGTGGGLDISFSVVVDNLGNVYVAGNSPGDTSANDITTIKYDSAGQQQWVRRYNGPGNSDDGTNGTNAIAVDDSGNVYVTGWSAGTENTDYVIIKYNSTGDEQWAQRYNGPGNGYDAPYGIALDSSGNVYVTGTSTGDGTGFDYATIKYDNDGEQQWVKSLNGTGNGYDAALALAIDASGNVCVTGISTAQNGLGDCVTIKYDTDGNQQWAKTYDGAANGNDYGNSVTVDTSSNVYVTGTSAGAETGQDYLTIKYDSSGQQLWASTYSSPKNNWDEGRSIGLDGSGNVYVTGVLAFSEGGSSDDWGTIKYDSTGAEQWVRIYDGPASIADEAWSIAVDVSGNSYVVGYSHGLTSGSDLTSIKYDTDGVEKWVEAYDSPTHGTDSGFDIAVDSQGNVYVTGASGLGIAIDYATIKYSQAGGPTPTPSPSPTPTPTPRATPAPRPRPTPHPRP
jgi:Beta-propeller repeat